MESSALFIIAGIHRKRAGSVVLIIGDPTEKFETPDEKARLDALLDINRSIRVGLEAMKLLIEQDRQAQTP
jgi:hypothetical protein